MGSRYNDLKISEEFARDYEKVNDDVKNRANLIVRLILDGGELPNSFDAHKAKGTQDLWIGRLTKVGLHYRVLFRIDNSTIVFERLLRHKEMDEYFRLYA